MTMRADHVYVPRTGDAAIRLDGPSLAACVSTHADSGVGQNRWHDVSVWEAESLGMDRYAVHIEYHTQWAAELPHDTAAVIPRGELRECLRAYDPLAYLAGFPPGGQWAERQARLRAELRERWDHAVSEVLAVMDVWEIPGGG
jgi:hypothetical protein